MSFTRYNTEDSVTSAEVVVRGAWTNDSNTLNNFFTSSAQSTDTTKYFLNVYDSATTSSLQFAIQYGHVSGSGSAYINPAVPGKTPTADVYGQYRNLIYGDENTNFTFDNTSSVDFWAINVARARYKESIQPGSLALTIGTKILTDDSLSTITTSYLGSNRYYNIVSGSVGNVNNTNTIYGYLFPDIGVILLHPAKLVSQAGISAPTVTANTDGANNTKLFSAISTGGNFKLQSAETISSRYFFTRVKNQEYNYTTNPSIIDNQGNLLFSTLINNPQTFITTVGLYNDNMELLAVAKLSKPLVKDFTKELLVRIKLDY
jgi:hypothetical protein